MLDFSQLVERMKRQRFVLLALGVFFVVRLVIDCSTIYLIAIAQIHSSINSVVSTAKSEINYTNGSWDTSAYNSDPDIPGNYRIYVIAKNGFMIDRWRPIPGYLDTSDFGQLMTYTSPATVHTVAGQTWRLLSFPLNLKGVSVGVLTVGKVIDPSDVNTATDGELSMAATDLSKGISLGSNTISTNSLDLQSVPSDISFQIVDQYNHIVLKNDHSSSIEALPNYIDTSYISNALQRSSLRTFTATTGERFLVQTSPLVDHNGSAYGTIVVARTITPTIQLVEKFFWIDGSISLLLLIGASTIIVKLRNRIRGDRVIEKAHRLHHKEVRKIAFDKEECMVHINECQLPFTYATNQYYMCIALFSKPNKKWEVDEILDKFGIENTPGAWRKIYDAMVSINKKCSVVMQPKLIVVSNKMYQINPALVGVIGKKK
jgi:hypothetical protein